MTYLHNDNGIFFTRLMMSLVRNQYIRILDNCGMLGFLVRYEMKLELMWVMCERKVRF